MHTGKGRKSVLRDWSGGKEKIELTLAQMESLILLDSPPFHLLGAKNLVNKKDLSPDIVAMFGGRYVEILRIAYGDTLADADRNCSWVFSLIKALGV